MAGKKLTEGQVRELLGRGKTRVGRFAPGHGPPLRGRLVLDVRALDREGGSPGVGDARLAGHALVRFEPAA